tara:strand:+ start:588 stop:806 length:219 start_codon:yes stop_codon:yes gene_type:complete
MKKTTTPTIPAFEHVKQAKIVMRSEWFGMAPRGAGLTMRQWVAIAKIIKRRKIRRCDWIKVKGVIDEYIYDR